MMTIIAKHFLLVATYYHRILTPAKFLNITEEVGQNLNFENAHDNLIYLGARVPKEIKLSSYAFS